MTPVALDLRWAANATAANMLCIARRFRVVGSLRLAGRAVAAAELEQLLGGCPVLAGLDLTQLERTLKPATGTIVRSVVERCPEPTALCIGGSDCVPLGSLPSTIGQLIGLKTLDRSRCEQLGSLPSEIGQLVGLKTLNLMF